MDTFIDSSWYFLRYTDALNDTMCFSEEAVSEWMNVDFYCGGIEHAQLHLIYARCWTKILRTSVSTTMTSPLPHPALSGYGESSDIQHGRR